MSPTISLVRELEFISTFQKKPVHFTFHLQGDYLGDIVKNLDIKIHNQIMELKYNNILFWRENVSISGMFGIESCSHINKIINLINNGEEYGQYCYFE